VAVVEIGDGVVDRLGLAYADVFAVGCAKLVEDLKSGGLDVEWCWDRTDPFVRTPGAR
jgi:hypothetical protein